MFKVNSPRIWHRVQLKYPNHNLKKKKKETRHQKKKNKNIFLKESVDFLLRKDK